MYRNNRENLVTNALPRRNNYVDNKHGNEGKEIGSLDAITKVVRAWYEEIYCSYKDVLHYKIL